MSCDLQAILSAFVKTISEKSTDFFLQKDDEHVIEKFFTQNDFSKLNVVITINQIRDVYLKLAEAQESIPFGSVAREILSNMRMLLGRVSYNEKNVLVGSNKIANADIVFRNYEITANGKYLSYLQARRALDEHTCEDLCAYYDERGNLTKIGSIISKDGRDILVRCGKEEYSLN